METVELKNHQNTVIPAQAGIQTEDVTPISLDPRLRGGDGKIDFAILVLRQRNATKCCDHITSPC